MGPPLFSIRLRQLSRTHTRPHSTGSSSLMCSEGRCPNCPYSETQNLKNHAVLDDSSHLPESAPLRRFKANAECRSGLRNTSWSSPPGPSLKPVERGSNLSMG